MLFRSQPRPILRPFSSTDTELLTDNLTGQNLRKSLYPNDLQRYSRFPNDRSPISREMSRSTTLAAPESDEGGRADGTKLTWPCPYRNTSSLPEDWSFGILPFLRHSGLDIRHSSRFPHFPFPHSCLFRISRFGFRISAGRRLAIASDWPTTNLVSLKVALMRGYARLMRAYARLSAVRRANARFELFRPFRVPTRFLHHFAPNCTKLQ